jgi:hypothetical protein
MAAPETIQARRAALLLHGLSPSKREQVMGKLEAAQVSRLKPLLEELTSLGLAPSQARQMQLPQIPSVPKEHGSALERALQLDVDCVARALESCSAATTAQLIRAAEWPWKTSLMDRMLAERRTAVLQLLAQEAPLLAPAVLEALCRNLCRELPDPLPSMSLTKGVSLGRLDPWPSQADRLRAYLRRFVPWTR